MKTGLIIAVVFVTITVFWWLKSGNWKKVNGQIQSFDIVQEYGSPGSGMSDHEGLFRYRVNIEYTYNFAGQQYRGTQISPGIPNVFSSESIARSTIDELRSGQQISVYFNPSNPDKSALITSQQFETKSIVIMALTILSVIMFVGGGVYVFNKI
jgi:hypothetical protein